MDATVHFPTEPLLFSIKCMDYSQSFESIHPALYRGSSGSPQTSQQGNDTLMQLEVFSKVKCHYSCIDLYNGTSNYESQLCASECINHGTKSESFTSEEAICLA